MASMNRLILPNQQQIPKAGDVQMDAQNGLVVVRQCIVITQAFPPDEAERYALGMLKTVELARAQAELIAHPVDENGIQYTA